jgi:hypothetical protein
MKMHDRRRPMTLRLASADIARTRRATTLLATTLLATMRLATKLLATTLLATMLLATMLLPTMLLATAAAQGTATPGRQTPPPQGDVAADESATGAAAAAATTPDGAHTQTAIEHFQQGLRFFEERDFDAALIEFRRANDMAPNYRVLYNIAVTYRELHDYASATAAFTRYLAEGGARIDAERQRVVRAELDAIEPRLGAIRITVDPAGAEVRIDDRVVGVSPLAEPIIVNIGSHVVEASAPDRDTATRRIEIAARDRAELSLVLRETRALSVAATATGGAVASTDTTGVSTATGGGGWGAGFWISLAATGVVGIAAVVTGILALDANSELDASLSRFRSPRRTPRGRARASRTSRSRPTF